MESVCVAGSRTMVCGGTKSSNTRPLESMEDQTSVPIDDENEWTDRRNE
jgi:hypothetical protein